MVGHGSSDVPDTRSKCLNWSATRLVLEAETGEISFFPFLHPLIDNIGIICMEPASLENMVPHKMNTSCLVLKVNSSIGWCGGQLVNSIVRKDVSNTHTHKHTMLSLSVKQVCLYKTSHEDKNTIFLMHLPLLDASGKTA